MLRPLAALKADDFLVHDDDQERPEARKEQAR